MKSKMFLVAVVGALVLLLAGSSLVLAYGGGNCPGMNGGMGNGMGMGNGNGANCFNGKQVVLTDAQKKEIAPLVAQKNDIHQQMLQKLVANGKITQADADRCLAHMKTRTENNLAAGRLDGMGFGTMGYGHRMQFTLTDEQRKELAPLATQMIDIQQQILQKLVNDGTIAQADADKQIAFMKDRASGKAFNGNNGRNGNGGQGYNCPNMNQQGQQNQ